MLSPSHRYELCATSTARDEKNGLPPIINAISNAVDSVSDAIDSANWNRAKVCAEERIKELTGQKIEVAMDVPSAHQEWVMKNGINSLCTEDTWDFVTDKSEYNRRCVELWARRGINKIIMKVNATPNKEEFEESTVCCVDWAEGSSTVTITWLPRALSWSTGNFWFESGYRTWWIIRDELVYGMRLYQLPGKCFYKSDWLDGFEDVDPGSLFPNAKKKFKRWFQFRHWVIYWYAEGQSGYNYQWTEKPPKNSDGTEFNLANVLKLPSMPSLTLPDIRLPSLPGMPGMPSLPNMPSLSMPSMPSLSMPSMPNLSAPSLAMPSLGEIPGIPQKPMRPKRKWDAHGSIELTDLKVKAKGSKLIFSNATITNFWEKKDGSYDTERKEKQRFEVEASDAEQAQSWVASLIEGGAVEGEDAVSCCTLM